MDRRGALTKSCTIGIRLLLSVVFLMLCFNGIYGESASGWHWYNERIIEKPIKSSIQPISAPYPYTQTMVKLQQATKEALNRAVLHPTEQNIHDYVLLQNFITTHASLFARTWQKMLLDYPELDFKVQHPTENNAQPIKAVVEKQQEEAAIRELSQHQGLFFFYRGRELLDQTLASTIVHFTQTYQIALVPVSVDQTLLPVFSDNANSQQDQGQAAHLGIRTFPALVLVDPYQQKATPLNYGFIAEDELRHRFLDVATNFEEHPL